VALNREIKVEEENIAQKIENKILITNN